MKKIDQEILKQLPSTFQLFYKLCKQAGVESNIVKKNDKNDNDKAQNFNKKSQHIQKTFFLDNES